ncbi:alpha-hydroxy-acid oxidizing protein [Nonomuraea thailandensis]
MEGARAVKCLALGARAIGLGRAALLAVDESAQDGLIALVRCIELELRLLISALGKYRPGALSAEDTWPRADGPPVVAHEPSVAGVQPSWQGGLP